MRGQHPWWLYSCLWHVSSHEYTQFLKMKTSVCIKRSHRKCWGLHLNREETAEHLWEAISPLELTLNWRLTSVLGATLWCLDPHLTCLSASALPITAAPRKWPRECLPHLKPGTQEPCIWGKGAASDHLAVLTPKSASRTWSPSCHVLFASPTNYVQGEADLLVSMCSAENCKTRSTLSKLWSLL